MSFLTIASLLGTAFATLCFFVVMIPPGFLLGWGLNLMQFRSRSATEQLLWSISLSVPLNLVIANVPGRYLPPAGSLFLFLALDVAALALIYRLWRGGRLVRFVLDRAARIVLLCVTGLLVYIPLAGAPLQFRGRLFEPVFSSDWEIRLPLIRASVRDGVPPHNPFFTFHGVSPATRYYYYWFSLCAQIVHLTHTDARSTLLASSAYAGLGILATLFLCLKYLLPNPQTLRQRCVILLGLCCVLGLDIVPSVMGLFVWRVRVRPEIEWWLPDRSPGLLGALMYAPHHMAGAACGFLVLLLLVGLQQKTSEGFWEAAAVYGSVIGLTFAAMAGTSTFITMFFAAAVSVLFLLSLSRRSLAVPAALVLAGGVSLLLSLPYLHELTAKTISTAGGTGAPVHLLGLAVRHSRFAHYQMLQIFRKRHLPLPHRAVRLLVRTSIILGLFVCETGFFLVIAFVQFRHDLRARKLLTDPASTLWVLAGVVAVFFAVITSAPVQFVNDLGVHAGLILRMILILWGAQVVAWYLAERTRRQWTPRERGAIRLACVFLVLGVGTAVWQIVMERAYLVLLNAHAVPAVDPFHGVKHLAQLYNDVYVAEATVDHLVPRDAVLQSNPDGGYQRLVRLYGLRRLAAGDETCEGAFGGDPLLCKSNLPAILTLFGTRGHRTGYYEHLQVTEADRTVAHLNAVCSQIGVAAFVATNADPVWYYKDSWVWQGHLLVGNDHVRIVGCPGT